LAGYGSFSFNEEITVPGHGCLKMRRDVSGGGRVNNLRLEGSSVVSIQPLAKGSIGTVDLPGAVHFLDQWRKALWLLVGCLHNGSDFLHATAGKPPVRTTPACGEWHQLRTAENPCGRHFRQTLP